MLPFQHHKQPVCRRGLRAFVVEGVTESGEEPISDRDNSLVTALALDDEQAPLSDPDVLKAQAEYPQRRNPASTIASSIARSRCVRRADISRSTS